MVLALLKLESKILIFLVPFILVFSSGSGLAVKSLDANILYKTGQYQAAVDALSQADAPLQAGRRQPAALYILANSRLALGDINGALKAYETLIAECTDSEWALCACQRVVALRRQAREWEQCAAAETQYLSFLLPHVYNNPMHPRIVSTLDNIGDNLRKTRPGFDSITLPLLLSEKYQGTNLSRIFSLNTSIQRWESGQKEEAARLLLNCINGVDLDMESVCYRAGILPSATPEISTLLAALEAVPDPQLQRRLFIGMADLWDQEPSAIYRCLRADIIPDGNEEEWRRTPVIALDREASIYGGSRTGLKDLSAYVHISWSTETLNILVLIRDDRHEQPNGEPLDMWKGDSIQISIAPFEVNIDDVVEGGGRTLEVGYTLHNDGRMMHYFWGRTPEVTSPDPGQYKIRRENRTCVYEVALPWARSVGIRNIRPGMKVRFDIAVNDSDHGNRDCWMEWTPGITEIKSPARFGILELVE